MKDIKNLLRNAPIIHMSDVLKQGISRHAFYGFLEKGEIERVSRGVYRLANGTLLEYPEIFEASSRVPNAVICLVSALWWYGITTQIPRYVSMAIPRRKRSPSLTGIRFWRFSDTSFQSGIEEVNIDGLSVKITSPEKTIADCFKFRNQIGMDVVLEALRLYRSNMKFNSDEILKQARICRVAGVITPYLESLL